MESEAQVIQVMLDLALVDAAEAITYANLSHDMHYLSANIVYGMHHGLNDWIYHQKRKLNVGTG